ncbi:MAG TPA: formimidoylglutamate deiminase [Thermoanaerobaculia bacterium]|nr:formimidoylglutamate deiminase [Thermoanaerobaculia bacterium]
MNKSEVIQADLTWTGNGFEPEIQLVVDGEGTISEAGRLHQRVDRRLRNRALLPGFVNAHSHAFQRGLRGLGELYPDGRGSFWSWREAMYGLVSELDADAFFRTTLLAFREMRAAGFTTVGEFHYLHHGGDSPDYAFDPLVAKAAAHAGIRLVLLTAFYKTGGPGKPLAESQRRFATPSLEDYWAHFDELAAALDARTQTMGVVAHSLRAADPGEVRELYAEASHRGLPFHIHVEEQEQEVADVEAAYGSRPLALLNEELPDCERLTAIHCTRSSASDLARFAERGGAVCLCPLTEANLGDGLADIPAMREAGLPLAIGTDCNARISACEEMRWLEYGQRLGTRQRGIVRDAEGHVATDLLHAATSSGERTLRLKAGRIEVGYAADLVSIDLDHPLLGGWRRESLLESFLFGSGNEAIAETCVAGRWLSHLPDEPTS